jgi:cytochrome c oxidase subunit 2
MRSWTEGAVALLVVVVLGIGLYLFSDQSLGSDSEGSGTEPITIDTDAAARGELLAESEGCLQCHTTDGSLTATGPTWKGLAGSIRPLTSGGDVVADDNYLMNSIIDPRSQIVEGYDAVMPTFFADQLDDAQIRDLVEYIKSLAT